MKTVQVGELKAHFSDILEEVKKGKQIGILYGKARRPVGMIVPYREEKLEKRPLGLLEGKVTIEFLDDYEMSDEELVGVIHDFSSRHAR